MSTPYNRPESARQESYLTFTPRRAIASFDNLVVLANYEEHLREARKIVWRDRGEPAVDIRDIRECLLHGARGGLRTSQVLHHSSITHPLFGRHHAGASAIAFAIRSGVNLVLLLARIKQLPRSGHPPPVCSHRDLLTLVSHQAKAFVSHTPCTLRIRFIPRRGHVRWALYSPYVHLVT